MKVPDTALHTKGVCNACGEVLLVTEENTAPLDEPPKVDDPWLKGADNCAKCGRPFRGDWDQHETSEGMLCNICANLATGAPPPKTAGPKRAPKPSPESEGEFIGIRKLEDEEEEVVTVRRARDENERKPYSIFGYGFDPDSPRFQKGLFIAAALVIAVTVFFVLTTDTAPAPEPAITETGEPAAEPPSGALLGALRIWGVITTFLGYFLTLYILLRVTEKLPHGELTRDFITIGGIALLFAGIDIGVSVLAAGIAGFPVAGGIFAAILGAGKYIVFLYLLLHFFDFGITDFILLIVFAVLINVLLGVISIPVRVMLENMLT